MPNDVIITPSTGRVQFVKDTGQALLRYNIDLSAATGLTIDSPLTSSVGIKSPNLPDLSGNNTFTGTSTFNGPTVINGNLSVYGATNIFSASNIYITSSVLTVTDNILTLNALSPYQRYAGIEMYDTGSGTISSILWDGTNDYFFLTGSGVNGKLITGPDGQTNLTSGYIPKATAGYKLGNSVVYDDGTRVGINTVSPSGSLTIQTNGTHLRLQTQNAPGSIFANIGARYDTTRPFTIEVANNNSTAAEFMGVYADGGGLDNRVVFPTGNVGIGLTNPSAKFHVTSSTNADEVLIGTIGNDQIVGGRTGGSFGIATKSTSNGNLILTSGNALYIRTSGSNDRVIVKNDGNVGIGTTSPAQLLELKKTTGSAIALLNYNDSVKFNINASSGGAGYVGMVTNHDLIFVTNDTERARLTSTGCVGIGTTSVRLNSLLTVYGSGAFGTSDYGFYVGTDATGTFLDAGTQLIRMFAGQVERIRIATDGNVGIGTTTTVARLHVNSTTAGATLLRTDGTNGTLFSVVDDLSDSLMSVNNSAGLPVLEVFADDRIVAGQYGQNDLVVRNNYVGIGTNNPTAKLCVSGSTSTPTAVFLVGNVGIGTTSPGYKLDVNGLASSTNGFLSRGSFSGMSGLSGALIDYDSGNTRIISNTAAGNSTISFLIGNSSAFSNAMVINSDGNVGIGTTSPAAKLDVTSATDTFSLINATNTAQGNRAALFMAARNVNGNVGNVSIEAISVNNQQNDMVFRTGATTMGGFGTERMRIATDGNVGIGTTSPATKFHVYGTGAGFEFGVNSPNCYIETIDRASVGKDLNTGYYTRGTGSFTWNNGAYTERMRIDGGGNVGIGITVPAAKLHCYNGSSGGQVSSNSNVIAIESNGNNGLQFLNPSANNANINFGDQSDNEIGFIQYQHATDAMRFRAGGTTIMSLVSGNVGIGTTAPAAKLHISGSSNDQLPQLIVHGVGAPATFNWASTFINSALSSSRNYISLIGQALSTRNSGYIGFNHSGTDGSTSNFLTFGLYGVDNILNINGNGRVGIGTTNPTQKLDIVGSYAAAGDSSGILKIRGGDTGADTQLNFGVSADGGYGWIQTTDVGLSNDRNIILNPLAGNVGIGTTSPGYKLEVSGTGFFSSNLTANGVTIGASDVRSSSNILTLGGTSEIIRITGGNVGIGTTSPATKLEVYGVVRVSESSSGGILQLTAGASAIDIASTFYGGSRRPITFTMDSEKMRIDSNGNVGIGTTLPQVKLQVVTDASTPAAVPAAGTYGGAAIFGADLRTYGLYVGAITNGNGYVQAQRGDTATTYNLLLQPNGGNVGIGTTTIDNKLSVGVSSPATLSNGSDGLRITDGTRIIQLLRLGSTYSYAGVAGSGSMLYSYDKLNIVADTTNPIIFNTGGGERMRIAADGNVGIGTTSPGYTLEVNGTQRVVGNFYLFNTVVNPASNFANQRGVGFEASTGKLEVAASGSNALSIGRFGSTGQILDFRYAGTQIGNFSLDTNDLTLATARHLILSPTGNVGIGTTSPGALLHVNNGEIWAFGATNERILLGDSTSAGQWGGFRWNTSVDNLQIVHSGYLSGATGAIEIVSSGNVGIGTTGPISRLNVYASGSNLSVLKVDGGNGTLFEVTDNLSGSLFSVNTIAGLPVLEVFSDNKIVAGQYGTNDFVISGSKIGIGTSVPNTAKLHIYDSTNSFTRYTNTTNAGHFVDVGANSGGQSFLFSYGAYPVLIGTNGAERIRVDSNGNVGIGTTSPSGKLHVVGNADIGDSTADTGIIVRHGAGSAQYGRIRFYDSNGLNVNTIHSFPVAWQGGTLLNSSAGAVNITGWNGVTFGSWNNVDVAFASNGTNYFKGNVGIGTTTPSASLHINSTTAGATLLRTDGTNGTLFSVVDDLSDSLMSVNNSAGLPVFEVFADDRIVSGQYGQNDLIVINNKVGIGTNNPLGKLHVTGSSSTPAAIFLGSVGIGTTSPTNALTVSGSANITGALTKGSGTFLINHPDPAKPGWKLQHSFVESPTVGDNIYRYIIDIDNTLSGSIELPRYWKFLNENPQIWINPVKHFGIAYGELNEELSVMNVYANSAGKYNILLIGTRKDPTIKRLMPEFNVEFESK